MSTVSGIAKVPNVQLPEELTKLNQLHTLIMSDCELTRIPPVVFHLTELKKLDISGNPLGQIPDEISYLRQLRCLIAKHMGLQTIPNQLTNCNRLQVLNLYGNQITTLPEELHKLQRLEQLYLDCRNFIKVVTTHNKQMSKSFGPNLSARTPNLFVQSLPKSLQTVLTDRESEHPGPAEDMNRASRSIIEKIKTLLKKGKMKSLHLPNVIFRLKSIRFLRLEQSSLNVLPENLGVMKLLESLNLAGNYFRQIPSELSGLHRSLKYLDLSDNILADGYNSLPAGFGKQLPNLTHLRMKHMGLREIEPESMVGFKRLRVLDLSENKITSIPDEMNELPELYSLDLSKNRLTELPISVCQLKQLADLNCRRNKISDLPNHLYRLKQIEQAHILEGLSRKGLWIMGNPLHSVPKTVWQTTSTKRLWKFLLNEKRKQTPEQQTIKCIVLGDRSSGRPKLLEQLVKYSHPEGRQANIWQNLTQVSYSPDLLNRPAETGDTLILPPVLISRCRSPNGVPIVFYELEHRPFPSQDDDHIPLFPLVHRHTFDGEALYIVVFDLSRLAFTDIEPEIVKSEFERNIGHHLIQIQMYAPGSVVSLVGIVSSAHRIHDHQLFDKYPKSEKFVRKSLIVQPVSESEDETGSTPSSVTPRDRFSLNEFLMDLANDYVREHVNRTGVENLIPIKILSPVKTMALGLVHTSSGDETFIGIHTPGEFWDDLEKRIYSPLFAHRRYKVPQSWNNLAESLCRDYSEKLLVRVILDNSETPGGPQSLFDQTDVITIKDLNAYGVTEVESCMRHCHTSGYLVWIREHYVLKNTIILQPTSFFRTLSGILCPLTAIIPPVCEAGCGRTDYLQHLTGLNQEQLSTSLQILRAHGTLDHKLLRAILPSVKRGDRTIGEGKSHSDRSARSTHKSRSRHPVKRSSRSTNKSSTRSSRWRPYPSRGKPWNLINPNRAVNDITPSHVANRTIVWLSELFQGKFATPQTSFDLSPCRSFSTHEFTSTSCHLYRHCARAYGDTVN
ncbi:hypothetical protein FBUS_03522 [Fasciolopsis buskii]|uniref:Disease resistance R13L4/SHOC-2-like LRR domain-containing protein n=1 Tax=Fasciolopsis buskii TaxID=27845 RepID=A0A8E0RWP0_9TREM|nr:hypothetical protein FBUS_03522 [Fasciolopsis buski]